MWLDYILVPWLLLSQRHPERILTVIEPNHIGYLAPGIIDSSYVEKT
jgi:hypothetical protein